MSLGSRRHHRRAACVRLADKIQPNRKISAAANSTVIETLEQRTLMCLDHVLAGLYDPNDPWTTDVIAGKGGELVDPVPAPPIPQPGLPLLHSRPGAPTAVYLDFTGQAGDGTAAYDEDSNTGSFNATEAANVTKAWTQMSKYFAMFNTDVTTAYPSVPFAWDAIGNNISGGYSFVGVFPNSSPQSHNNSGDARTRVSGLAHEFGHNFGLQHQSDYSQLGVKINEYSSGFDSLHGPIMGVDYAQSVHKWFIGHPATSPSALQDDMAVISNSIKARAGGDGFAPDDFGNNIATATALTFTGGVSQRVGVLERMSDVDAFSLAGGGTFSFDAVADAPSGVDLKLSIYQSDGTLLSMVDTSANDQHLTMSLPAGSNYFALLSSHGNYGDVGQYIFTVSALPPEWGSQDIGTPTLAGAGSFDSGSATFAINGAGNTIASSGTDQFRFAYQALTGDGSIVAQVNSLNTTSSGSKAGIMIRDGLTNTARLVFADVTPSSGVQFSRRYSSGGAITTTTASGINAPQWLKLERVGNVFTASRSVDGVGWAVIGSDTVTMGNTVYMGLGVGSASTNVMASGAFGNVSLTGSLGASPIYNGLPAPSGLAASAAASGTGMSLAWNDISGETGYAIERSADGVNFTQIATPAADQTTYTDNGTAIGSLRYFYRISALDPTGRSAPSTVASGLNRPSAVTNLSVTSLSTTQIVLNWRDTNGESSYRIERSLDNVTWSSLGNVGTNVPSYTNSGMSTASIYYYRVTPLSSVGDGLAATVLGGTRLTTVTGTAFTKVSSNQFRFTWNDLPNETGYRIERSTDGTNFSTFVNLAQNITSYTDGTVTPLGEYYYRVVGTNSVSESISTNVIFAAAPASTLPTGWNSVDIGGVGGAGAAGYAGGTYTSVGSGADISSVADKFRFVYQQMSGDGEIIARVASLENTDAQAKAGVMFRESLAPGARNAIAYVTPTNGVHFQTRVTTGGATAIANGTTAAAPIWLRLVRSGDTVTAYQSGDGSAWTQIGSPTTVSMTNPTIYVGLAVTSRNDTLLAKATFDSVSGSALNQTDSVAPDAPAINSFSSDTGASSSDRITSDNTLSFSGSAEPASFVTISRADVGAIGTVQTNYLGNWSFDYTDTALPDGAYSFTASAKDASNNVSSASATFDVTVDRTPPVVLPTAAFNYLTSQFVTLPFSEDVGNTFTAADVSVVNVTSGQPITAAASYDPYTRTATLTFPGGGTLPDGNYHVTAAAGSFNDLAGNVNTAALSFDFFVLAGDANHDGSVDVSDLGVLATNWQSSGKTFADGDFNYDGVVDVSDLGILATSWQKSLPAPAAPTAAVKAVTAAPAAQPLSSRNTIHHTVADDILS
jgi:hypothetical protein